MPPATGLSALRGVLAALAVFSAVTAPLFPAADSPPPAPTAPDILHLPDMTVTDRPALPPPEAWNYTKASGFEVLSSASERSTVRLLRDFQIFREALGLAWPIPQRAAASAVLVLCGRGNQFDRFVPAGQTRADLGTASLFLQNPEQIAIVVDLQTTSLNLTNLAAGATGSSSFVEFEVDAYRELYRAYVHFLLNRVESRPPAWLEEGMTQIALDMDFTENSVVFGKIDSTKGAAATSRSGGTAAEEEDEATTDEDGFGNTTVGDRPFNVVLNRRALLPLDRLFAVGHDSTEARNPLGDNLWAKQSYAFVHLCLYGDGGRQQKAFAQFVQRLGKEPPHEALFKECFKMSYKDMLIRLRGYIGFTDHKYQTFTLKDGAKFGGDKVVLREATQAEVGRIKGDAQRLAGRGPDALETYRDAYQRGERDPQLLAALGLAEAETGRPDRARQLLEAVAPANVPRPAACVALARLRFAGFTATGGGKLDPTQVKTVLEPLGTAVRQRPPLPATYQLIAETWSASALPPTRDQLVVLVDGVRLFPRHSELVYLTAQLHTRAGATDQAAALARLGVKTAADAATRARFENLLASLSPPVPAAR